MDNIVNAPIYSLEVSEVIFSCLTDDEITIAEGDPTLEETEAAET